MSNRVIYRNGAKFNSSDILEYASKSEFPTTGEAEKIYVDKSEDILYRYDTANGYTVIGSSIKIGTETGTALDGKIGTDHINNTSNPHNVTKAQVGLTNVEDKSSATIRSEITSSNVTTALGYTPYNSTNPSGFVTSSGTVANANNLVKGDITGEDAMNAFRSGDVMKIARYSLYQISGFGANCGKVIMIPQSENYQTQIAFDEQSNKMAIRTYIFSKWTDWDVIPVGSIPTLGSDGKIPMSQLPSDVDDVLEYDTKDDFPTTGETGKIYIDKEKNNIYRYDATDGYTIMGSTKIGTETGTAMDGKIGTDHINNKSNPHEVTKDQLGLGNVDNKSSETIRGEITSSNVTTALGYTPYNSTNPSGYLTSSGTINYANSLVRGDITGEAAVNAFRDGNVMKLTRYCLYQISGFGSNYGKLVMIPQSENYQTQIAFDEQSNRIAVRTYIFSKWTDWTLLASSADIPTSLPASDVYAWAKEATKPTYTASEVGALADSTTHLSGDIATSEKGVASGVATLGTDGKVPTSQLPSYVDDVVEYDTKDDFPTEGESGKIYVALDTNLTYRWSGTGYVEISPSLALGETSSTAYAGDKGKAVTDALATHKADTTSHITADERTSWNSKTSNTGTVTSVTVKMNDTDKGTVTTSGTIDLGTVITAHQDISGKADKSTTLSGYGITDAKIESGVITLGENTITPVTDISGKQDKLTAGDNITIEGTTISATDTKYSEATTSTAGLMSSADKTKLDGVAEGATANTGTVTSVGIKMNGEDKGSVTTSGTIDLGTVITSHQDISGKADKATTLAGYGITDAKISDGVITLGENTITPLTSHQDISGKQDKLTAGDNITIDGTTISADGAIVGTKAEIEAKIAAGEIGEGDKVVITDDENDYVIYQVTVDGALSSTSENPVQNKVITAALNNYALVTEAGYSLGLSIDTSTYVMTLQLKNKAGTVLDSKTIDFPIESMVVNASYADGKLTLTLQNGQTLTVDISDIVSGLVKTSDIVDNLTSTDTDKPLSAYQGKVLNDSKVNTSDIVDNVTSTDTDKPLSANQGKVLQEEIGTKDTSYFGAGTGFGVTYTSSVYSAALSKFTSVDGTISFSSTTISEDVLNSMIDKIVYIDKQYSFNGMGYYQYIRPGYYQILQGYPSGSSYYLLFTTYRDTAYTTYADNKESYTKFIATDYSSLSGIIKDIDELESNKVNVTDVQDNLTSTSTTNPLSANQGKNLKGEIGDAGYWGTISSCVSRGTGYCPTIKSIDGAFSNYFGTSTQWENLLLNKIIYVPEGTMTSDSKYYIKGGYYELLKGYKYGGDAYILQISVYSDAECTTIYKDCEAYSQYISETVPTTPTGLHKDILDLQNSVVIGTNEEIQAKITAGTLADGAVVVITDVI